MAGYSYKDVISLIPERIADRYEDLDDPSIEGDLYEAASDYIVGLELEVKRLKKASGRY